MKFLCPACERLADVAGARVSEGTVALRCARCGVESSEALPRPGGGLAMPAPHATPPAETVAPDPVRTPPALEPSAPDMGGGAASVRVPSPEAVGSATATALAAVDPSPAATTPADPGRLVLLRAVGTGAPSQRPDPLAVPQGYCPKCVSRIRMSGPTCASCGLAFERFDPAEYAPAASLLTAWAELAERWDDSDAHDRFLQRAAVEDSLASAGRLYRIQLAHHPDDPQAARGRDEVLRRAAAVTPLSQLRDLSSSEPGTPRWQLWAAGLVAVALLLMMGYFIRQLRAGAP